MPKRRELIAGLAKIVGDENVLFRPEDLLVYEFDGTVERQTPYAVAFPADAEETAALIRFCNRMGMPLTPRGAGTGLSGGSVPTRRGVVIATARMRSILEIDAVNRIAVVEPGLPNLQLSEAVAVHGLFYAPDPS
ncbi:MAG: FAD-binding protein, partial [Tepidiformaceae bacterium]